MFVQRVNVYALGYEVSAVPECLGRRKVWIERL